MSTPDSDLDQRLQLLFRGFDASPDFDARLMARLQAEARTDAVERAMRAREQERERHGRALSEARLWRRSMLRLMTLDVLGVGLLLVVAAVSVWPRLDPQVAEGLRQFAPYIVSCVAVVLGVVPLRGIWGERYRGTVGLL
jgi:hypothetical protein